MPFKIHTYVAPLLLAMAATISAQEVETVETTSPGDNCSYNATTPIIPDGNVASKDELVSAQARIKYYQDSLLDFRECLSLAEKELDPEAPGYEDAKKALVARSNESIDLETKVAEEFNKAVRAFKER